MSRLHRSPIWSDPRVKPPFGAVKINWGHPLARDIRCCLLMNEGGGPRLSDLASPSRVVTLTGMPWRPSRFGLGVDNNSDGDEIDLSPGIALTANLGFSDFFLIAVDTYNATNPGFWRTGAASDGGTFHIRDTTSFINRPWLRVNGVNVLQSGPADTLVDGQIISHGCSVQSAARAAVYIDGQEIVATTHTTATETATINNIGWQSTTASRIDGQWALFYFWQRALSPDEHRWLHAEPYDFLQPVIRRRYFVPAAAGAATWPGWMSNKGGWV